MGGGECGGDAMIDFSRRHPPGIDAEALVGESDVEVPYRGESGALFKRDYGARIARACPNLEFRDSGRLNGPGWDNLTWWLFERRSVATAAVT